MDKSGDKSGNATRCLDVLSRRSFMTGAVTATASALLGTPFSSAWGQSSKTVTFGLTPVFLDSDIKLLADLKGYLQKRLGRHVNLIKKRTYQEIMLMLLSGQLDAAWICGFPFVRYQDQLSLMTVPVYNAKPLYQSYVIVNEAQDSRTFADLRGHSHAFSDPDSNSGFLVSRALLADMNEKPETFFSRSFFTYGHRNVIRAVSSGLAQSGSVDGYVWDVMNSIEPQLTAKTRVIRKSEWLGFPPIACKKTAENSPLTQAISEAFIAMPQDPLGRKVLSALYLDGFQYASPALFERIGELYKAVENQA